MKSDHLSPLFYLLILLTLLSGCATVDQKLSLIYRPVDRPFGRNTGEILVSRTDAGSPLKNKSGEWIVGSQNNVHGVRQADLLSDRSVGEWISDALVQELGQAGYKASYVTTLPEGVARAVRISDINVFMNVNKGILTTDTRQELKFDVDIILGGTKVKTLAIAARDNKTLTFSASLEEKEVIMRQSLKDAMQQLIPELIVQFNKK